MIFYMIINLFLVKISAYSTRLLQLSDTYCIETCTELCIDKPDVYSCFDDCTLKECSNNSPASVSESSIPSPKSISLILLLLFLSHKALSYLSQYLRKPRPNTKT